MPQLAFAVAPILAQADDGGGSNILGFLLPLVILGGLFYVMLYLPRRRQAKKAERMLDAISVGDEKINRRANQFVGIPIASKSFDQVRVGRSETPDRTCA